MPHRLPNEQIPDYLKTYIVEQDPSLYTPMDHASWRYILKISRVFFAKHAHQMYVDGLRETGISTERVPLISEMDQALRKFGWRAVAVSGFIPPAAFMEFLSRGVLPIACDMRKIENLAYTPAPDIVHEAAGHAPIIADPEYAKYLRHYGELAEKAIYSSQDLDVYNAVRDLSDTKEDPRSTEQQIARAQKKLDEAVAAVDHVSEATELGRMGWWTIEYGLIGTPENPKIYGAGLLSSVGESFNCLRAEVKKIPFSVDCVETSYDITKPQPQLFLAPDFNALKNGLDSLAARMAFRLGGIEGLTKAKQARVTTTTVFESGIQISGPLADFLTDKRGEPTYLKFQGPTQLAFDYDELPGQGATYHAQGFGTPVGTVKGRSPADLSREEFSRGKIEFDSGVVVEGRLKDLVQKNGKNLVAAFENCKVTLGSQILFDPSWGTFDMACGAKVVSVFGDAADRRKYLEATGGYKQVPGKPKTNLTAANRELNEFYAIVRKIREDDKAREAAAELARIHSRLEEKFREDWLLRYELLELNSSAKLNAPWATTCRQRMNETAARSSEQMRDTIARGLELL